MNVDVVDSALLPRGTTLQTRRVTSGDNTITLGPDMVFFRGQLVRYDAAPGATAIGGLVSGGYYYAIPTADGTGIQLAATTALIPLTLTAGSTAALLLQSHSLTPVQRFTVTADADAFLDVLGVQRIATATTYTVLIDAVTTGGNADLLLQPSVRETPTGATAGVLVKWPANPTTGVVHRVYFTPDSSCPANCSRPASGSGGTFLAQVDSTYDLRARDITVAGAPYVLPGIVAGGSIIVEAAQPTAASPRTINVFGIVDVLSTGYVDVLTNGWITLNEHTGDLRVGRILSTLDDVLLYAPGRIVDALGGLTGDVKNGVVADVSGRNITMCAGSGQVLDGTIADPLCRDTDRTRGGIGDPTNFLEIDVAYGTGSSGVLRAFDRTSTAGRGIFLTETIGALRLFEVNTLGDVALTTVNGSIIDARSATPGLADVAQVYANTVDIDAVGGGIGGPATTSTSTPRTRPRGRRAQARHLDLGHGDPGHARPGPRRGPRGQRAPHRARDGTANTEPSAPRPSPASVSRGPDPRRCDDDARARQLRVGRVPRGHGRPRITGGDRRRRLRHRGCQRLRAHPGGDPARRHRDSAAARRCRPRHPRRGPRPAPRRPRPLPRDR